MELRTGISKKNRPGKEAANRFTVTVSTSCVVLSNNNNDHYDGYPGICNLIIMNESVQHGIAQKYKTLPKNFFYMIVDLLNAILFLLIVDGILFSI